MKIALIACSKEKLDHICPARELYSASTLFSLSYRYAQGWADKIYILSAKHGLVAENQRLAPYNQTLKDMTRQEQLRWADGVMGQLAQVSDPQNDEYVFLAGSTYTRDLAPRLVHHTQPLEGLRMGERMAHLKKLLETPRESMCLRLHRLFAGLPRYNWEKIQDIPFDNGIYIVFERGEAYHGLERIVRVGTHTAEHRLKPRLVDHFVRENHDGSIFRKNIGKAILNAYNDPYLPTWTLDTSRPENKALADPEKNADTEKRVSKYLRENFTFTVFPVEGKNQRLRLEEAIIATLHRERDFGPGSKWAGRFSPEREIRESGLWLKQGLDGAPLTEEEFLRLQGLCRPETEAAAPPMEAPPPTPQKTGGSCGIYAPLHRFLLGQTGERIVLPMKEIEAILGFPLPKSAYTYPMWYNPKGHPHCQAWLQAGYRVENVARCIKEKTITFVRK